MDKPKTETPIDIRTLDRLFEELRDVHAQLGTNMRKLQGATRFSDAYHDSLAAIYTQLTLMKCLADDLQAEMDRLDDQLPDE